MAEATANSVAAQICCPTIDFTEAGIVTAK